MMVILGMFLASDDLDIWPFQLKIGTPVTPAVEKVQTNPKRLLVFDIGAHTGQTDRRRDKQRDGRTGG